MKNLLDTLCFVAILLLVSGLLVEAMLLASMADTPPIVEPGDEIVVLSGQTIVLDGRPCQENRQGFISFTSPEGTQSWHKSSSWFFPTHRLISIIYSDGNTEWVKDSLVVIPTAELQLCPSQ